MRNTLFFFILSLISSVSYGLRISNITDENPRTFWVATANKAEEWVTIDLEKAYEVKTLQVNYTDYQSDIYFSDSTVYTQFRMYSSIDRVGWIGKSF